MKFCSSNGFDSSSFVWGWGWMLLMAGKYASASEKTLSSLQRSLPPLCFVCLFIAAERGLLKLLLFEMNQGLGLILSYLWLNNVNLHAGFIARCWMCFRKPLCEFLSSSALNDNEKGPTQCNETMGEVQHIARHSHAPHCEVCSVIVFYHGCIQLQMSREINVRSHASGNVLICAFQPPA